MAVDRSLVKINPWPHRLAIVLACATFPLIWVGGLVTTYDAGMAVPDWPTTYGYNLFLYPWQTWLFGPFDLFIEHGHRLLGAAVGLLAMGFVAAVWVTDRRPGMKIAAGMAFLLVGVQGVLGGLRVLWDERQLAMIHACFGLATFAYLSAIAVITSRSWHQRPAPADSLSAPRRLQRLSWAMVGVTYLQVLVGATLRHIPVGASYQFFRVAVLLHLVLAAAVFVQAMLLLHGVWREREGDPRLRRTSAILAGLVVLQLLLGGGTWVLKYSWPGWLAQWSFAASYTIQANSFLQALVTTAHVAIGALILAQAVVFSLRTVCFFRSAAVSSASRVFSIGWTT